MAIVGCAGSGAGQPREVDGCSVDDTTEVRWFKLGSLPPDVRVWFTSSIAVPEERCNTYLLVGREDVGVKRRFRETLEFKVPGSRSVPSRRGHSRSRSSHA